MRAFAKWWDVTITENGKTRDVRVFAERDRVDGTVQQNAPGATVNAVRWAQR